MTRAELMTALKRNPMDYRPFGVVLQDGGLNCRSGCLYYQPVKSHKDFGVCASPKSHRRGLLTFWEQGCMYRKKS